MYPKYSLYSSSSCLYFLILWNLLPTSVVGDTPGDYLLTEWCNTTDPRQQFSFTQLPLIMTTSGNCIASTIDNTSLTVVTCDLSDPRQNWFFLQAGNEVYIQQNISTVCFNWNLQSLHQHDYVQDGDAVALWTCTTPSWNSEFIITSPSSSSSFVASSMMMTSSDNFSPSSIGIAYTENQNSTPTNLCVSTVSTSLPPVPTADQLAWQENEIACFLVWNIATSIDSQGCGNGPPPSIDVFLPSDVDTDNWIESCRNMGGKRIVLTVKHMCGFLLFPVSNVTPEYTYTIENIVPPYTNMDIMDKMVQSCQKYNGEVSPGVYYSITENSYCNVHNGQVQPGPINSTLQLNVTQEEYDLTVLSHLTLLYGKYPNSIGEVWFDGGIPEIYYPPLKAIVSELQPNTIAFQGEYISNNPVRWIGSESGYSPYPVWSTCDYSSYGAGSPDSLNYYPAESDFTLLDQDTWFYDPTKTVRSSSVLRSMYETSVGHNSNVIIGFAPFPNGSIPMDQQTAASTLGTFISQCYQSSPIGNTTASSNTTVTVQPFDSNNNNIDRIMVREDLKYGQRIRTFTLEALLTNGTVINILDWVNMVGTAIGNKFIVLLPETLSVTSVTLTINLSIGTPYIRTVTLLQCNGYAETLDAAWEAQYGSHHYNAAEEYGNVRSSTDDTTPKWRPHRRSKYSKI